MSAKFQIETERLLLRCWQEDDAEPFAEMCADPEVMRHFPERLSYEKSKRLIAMGISCFEKHGVFYSPVEVKATGNFIGFVGLDVHNKDTELPFAPCVDIGWRLKQSAWGKGYASEAARAWLRFGFETIGLEEIVAFTIPANLPSQKVMERIGMTRDMDGDFFHPAFPKDHPIAPHVLFRLSSLEWRKQTEQS